MIFLSIESKSVKGKFNFTTTLKIMCLHFDGAYCRKLFDEHKEKIGLRRMFAYNCVILMSKGKVETLPLIKFTGDFHA